MLGVVNSTALGGDCFYMDHATTLKDFKEHSCDTFSEQVCVFSCLQGKGVKFAVVRGCVICFSCSQGEAEKEISFNASSSSDFPWASKEDNETP